MWAFDQPNAHVIPLVPVHAFKLVGLSPLAKRYVQATIFFTGLKKLCGHYVFFKAAEGVLVQKPRFHP